MQKLLQILCFVIFLFQKQITTSITQIEKNIDYLKGTFCFDLINNSIPSEIQIIFDQSKKFNEAVKTNTLQKFCNPNNEAPTHTPNQKKTTIYPSTTPTKQYNPCLKFIESLNDKNHTNHKLIIKYNQAIEEEKPNLLQKLTELFIKECIEDYEKYTIIYHVKTLINKSTTKKIPNNNFFSEFSSQFPKQEGMILTNFIEYFLQEEFNKKDTVNLVQKYPIEAIKTKLNNQKNISNLAFFNEIIDLCKLQIMKNDNNNNLQSSLYEYEQQISSVLKINNLDDLKQILKKNQEDKNEIVFFQIFISIMKNSSINVIDKRNLLIILQKTINNNNNNNEQNQAQLDLNITNTDSEKNCYKILEETIKISKRYYKKFQLILDKLKNTDNQTLNNKLKNSSNTMQSAILEEIKNDINKYHQNIQKISAILDKNTTLSNNSTLNISNEIKKEKPILSTENIKLNFQDALKNQLLPFLLTSLSKMKEIESKSENQILQEIIKASKNIIANIEKSTKSENNEELIQLTREQREDQEEKIYYQTIYKKKQAIWNPLNQQIICLMNQLKLALQNWIKISFKDNKNTLINQTIEKIQSKSTTFNEILKDLQKIEFLYNDKNPINFDINKEKECFEQIQDKLILLQNQKSNLINKLEKEMEKKRYNNLKKTQNKLQEAITHYKKKEYQNINFNKKEQKIVIISVSFISFMLIYTLYSKKSSNNDITI